MLTIWLTRDANHNEDLNLINGGFQLLTEVAPLPQVTLVTPCCSVETTATTTPSLPPEAKPLDATPLEVRKLGLVGISGISVSPQLGTFFYKQGRLVHLPMVFSGAEDFLDYISFSITTRTTQSDDEFSTIEKWQKYKTEYTTQIMANLNKWWEMKQLCT